MRQVSCSVSSGGVMTDSKTADSGYNKLQNTKVWLVSDQKEVEITSLWGDDDHAFLVFARSMGCNFCQQLARELKQDVLPKLQGRGIKLFLVSMGPPERGLEFAQLTGFPADQLLADPENLSYDRLQLKNSGPFWTFFDPRTPLTLAKRAAKDGLKSTVNALANWRPWIPTKKGQAHQQGGAFLFHGKQLLWDHYDEATGAHAEPEMILERAAELV
eukprot:CAMPEP_0206134914 /NCGR_PEP_ID=MMETSP1473-20131121/303_1 /ASSEMBLY_ACC=CAM_ASM_001109 /TAXON_ID=1461547 /ORGANISM="Stichococcus sp, Strain RCC1054" /LENGTH=215 /DNA_ID=CAMNT_0053526555 /DNA_START=346 /DNA_END=993 /DNA_ORIENTATION=-